MKKIRSDNTPEFDWPAAVGMALVVGLICLFALNAAGGWAWTAKFLESSAAAWVQAVGSVAAIFAAIAVVNKQHALEMHRRNENDRTANRHRIRAMRTIIFSAAKNCEKVAGLVGKENTYWPFYSETLGDARTRLISIDPFLIPDASLLLLIEEISLGLYSCAVLVKELKTHKSDEINVHVRATLMKVARDCWLGFYEASKLESRLINGLDVDLDRAVFSDFKESKKHLDQIRAEFVKNKNTDIS